MIKLTHAFEYVVVQPHLAVSHVLPILILISVAFARSIVASSAHSSSRILAATSAPSPLPPSLAHILASHDRIASHRIRSTSGGRKHYHSADEERYIQQGSAIRSKLGIIIIHDDRRCHCTHTPSPPPRPVSRPTIDVVRLSFHLPLLLLVAFVPSSDVASRT